MTASYVLSSSSKDPIFMWSGAIDASSLWTVYSSIFAEEISSARPVSTKIPFRIFLSDFSFCWAIPSSYPVLNESEILLFSGTTDYFILYLPCVGGISDFIFDSIFTI